MGLLSSLKKIFSAQSPTPNEPINIPASSEKKLTYAEKELLAVQRTTQDDVQQLKGFPYSWNRSIEKFIKPNGHPFVYMDIVGDNLAIAKSELEKVNSFIDRDKSLCKKIPASLKIPTSDIVFSRSNDKGYTRLICSPVTYDGKPTKLPLSLSFMTDLERKDTTHGDIYYNTEGNIQKADLYFWRRGNGYFLFYDTYDGELILARMEDDSRSIIHKGKPLLDREADLTKTEKDYEWLQANFPDKCPKSITSYRRMKTQNTKNYQLLKQLAANHGRDI